MKEEERKTRKKSRKKKKREKKIIINSVFKSCVYITIIVTKNKDDTWLLWLSLFLG